MFVPVAASLKYRCRGKVMKNDILFMNMSLLVAVFLKSESIHFVILFQIPIRAATRVSVELIRPSG